MRLAERVDRHPSGVTMLKPPGHTEVRVGLRQRTVAYEIAAQQPGMDDVEGSVFIALGTEVGDGIGHGRRTQLLAQIVADVDGKGAVPSRGTAHGTLVWPEAGDPDRDARLLQRGWQEGARASLQGLSSVVHGSAAPQGSQQVKALIEDATAQLAVSGIAEGGELPLVEVAQADAHDEAAPG